jgi:hypothetical protein
MQRALFNKLRMRVYPDPDGPRLCDRDQRTKMSKFICSICHVFASPSFGGVFRHISSEHAFEADFRVICGIDGCQATYRKLSSWKTHLYRNHKGMSALVSKSKTLTVNYIVQVYQWFLLHHQNQPVVSHGSIGG